ncbi:MAG: type I phosphomannose isomerase catalytic subunit [Planctomycetota bacterium]
MNLYPFKFEPIYKERIWGGRTLEKFFARRLPPNRKIGESWELADLPEDISVISNGFLAGRTLRSAIEQYPRQITGNTGFLPPFPLLIKILDAADILSVQVHPDAQTCQRMGKGHPKTECWYIISAESNAVIYKGLKPGTTKNQFARAIENGTTAELLNKDRVHRGECHFLPAGTVHAIGAGLLIAEIQLPSDTTYRVFDWNRTDPDGKPRQLHIEEALQSIHFDPSGDDLSVRNEGRLADCAYFKIDKVCPGLGRPFTLNKGIMKVLIMITGKGKITADKTEPVAFTAGDTLLLPANFAGTITCDSRTQYLAVTL